MLVADGAGVPFNSIGKVGTLGTTPELGTDARYSGKVVRACGGTQSRAGIPAAAPLPRWKFFSPERLADADLDRVLLCRTEYIVRYLTH